MTFEAIVKTVEDPNSGDRPTFEWRVELFRDGEFVAGVTDACLGEAFKDAYLTALQAEVER